MIQFYLNQNFIKTSKTVANKNIEQKRKTVLGMMDDL